MDTRFLLPLLGLLMACPPKADVDDTGLPDTDGGATDGGSADGGSADGGSADGGSSDGGSGDGGSTDGTQTTAVVATLAQDYSTGSLAEISIADWTVTDEITTTSGDPHVSVDDGYVFQINSYGYDTVRVYTPGDYSAPVMELSVGTSGPGPNPSTNPYDAHICDGKLFVSLYGRDYLPWYDPSSGLLGGTVDLSAYADGDNSGPEANQMVERDGKLYVGLNRLDRNSGWTTVGGKVIEIDCETGTITNDWDVAGNTQVFDWEGHSEVLAGGSAYGDQGGGLYVIDPAADTVTRVLDFDADEQNVAHVAAWGNKAVVVTSAWDYSGYSVYCADLGSGTTSLAESFVEYLTDAAANDHGEAWVAANWGW
ncbi:MAG: hypothetical protein D6798_09550, partial [Deltaproteobacteria bacterium]